MKEKKWKIKIKTFNTKKMNFDVFKVKQEHWYDPIDFDFRKHKHGRWIIESIQLYDSIKTLVIYVDPE